MIPALRNKNYMQLAWVVPSLEEAIADWVRTAGAGPFFVFEELHFTESMYRGTPADIQPCRAAIGQHGDMQIELIQPLADEPGIWSDVVPFGQRGFHHTGLYCTDYDGEREAALEGGVMGFEGLMLGARTCYVDTTGTLGFMTELIAANPVAEMVFGQVRAAAEGWDGSDPIRTLG
ncbi:MAG: VOC family protein [Sphingomonadales bacterium]|nr:VOC family protein [Sphingomonadales bacterium]